ncbi:HEPN domain-containing protein [Rhizobium sp. VS19-DR104.2]|uniref:HEPN domain-containing protein n=1 Tax=unclassified Rhizobium TaxID=2613769 RepID=UPI001CC42464|nr:MULTISPECIES: HEPN domain-containing protein [unclassified Rhizobium]MBZ5761928.1 HEPN domain-containing protein [Rhizobium sp. VS19-DR96]MBZ5768900.1 HEPN domain-containing protein [Rhizobium sp. VS19-DR129.2]MBZ5775696.1 HEPN domain-containing protein [Rhizobium sp. VS19-DRK62.2]MBZ5786806.1 HEPN domain-containing protein [Rhizobium sp. VS19-DR121]MBZ5805016.1 HEPN domain-containing protein [Rhizobium sp. VS19-DR181]
MIFPEKLEHLPHTKRRELSHVVQVIFDTFEDAQKTKMSEKARSGRILKLILFGSYARGDWVEDHTSGYRSDYDLLAVVNTNRHAEDNDVWLTIDDRLTRDFMISQHLATPAKVIVHSLADINDKLTRGLPFFVDIARDGIVLYEAPGFPLAEPKALTPEAQRLEAKRHFDHWFPRIVDFLQGAAFYSEKGNSSLAAFNLHQATESAYHCVLLVLTLYSPKSHRLSMLRLHAERIDARLVEAWLGDQKFARRCFTRLDRAYVDARYSAHYEITNEELEWLFDRIKKLQGIVAGICTERLRQGAP